jgi:hypothetical protein
VCLQTEKSYQKQDAVFIARKRVIGKKSKSKKVRCKGGLSCAGRVCAIMVTAAQPCAVMS